jgi:DNA-directed RNA polymerase subunit beta
LQSLALDVRILDKEGEEIDLKQTFEDEPGFGVPERAAERPDLSILPDEDEELEDEELEDEEEYLPEDEELEEEDLLDDYSDDYKAEE